jgi:hypothetical protein
MIGSMDPLFYLWIVEITKAVFVIANIITFIVIIYYQQCERQYKTIKSLFPYELTPQTIYKILFVIAHPDDEAMFMTPTLFAMKGNVEVHLLCLSTGIYHLLCCFTENHRRCRWVRKYPKTRIDIELRYIGNSKRICNHH